MKMRFSDRQYTAFVPLLVILLTLVALQITGLTSTYEQRKQLNSNISQLGKADEDVKKVDKALGEVSGDLLTLSETNERARQVVNEFQIRRNASEAPGL